MSVLVDTSVWIEFFKPAGNRRAREALAVALQEDTVVTAAPVLTELLIGLDPASAADARAIQLIQALSVVELNWEVCERAGALGRTLVRRGQRVPAVDLMIAAAAFCDGHEIWHVGDRHFATIERVGGPRQRDLRFHPG